MSLSQPVILLLEDVMVALRWDARFQEKNVINTLGNVLMEV